MTAKTEWKAQRAPLRALASGYQMVEVQVNLDRLFPEAVKMPSTAPLFLGIQEARALGRWLLENTPEDGE